jgi:hypothetical protein
VIWVRGQANNSEKQKYFFAKGGTGQITLIRLDKFADARNEATGRGMWLSPSGNPSRSCRGVMGIASASSYVLAFPRLLRNRTCPEMPKSTMTRIGHSTSRVIWNCTGVSTVQD